MPRVQPKENTTYIWARHHVWPEAAFQPEVQSKADLLSKRDTSANDAAPPEVQQVVMNGVLYKRRVPVLTDLPDSDGVGEREIPDGVYKDERYESRLMAKGSFMEDLELKGSPARRVLCEQLLERPQTVPADILCRAPHFERFCQVLAHRNESLIFRLLNPFIVPSAMEMGIRGDEGLWPLTEHAKEQWTHCIPFVGPQPEPDYSIGFDRLAFGLDHMSKLEMLVGGAEERSYFAATELMIFPFLTCEVNQSLNVADRQNAHSMTLAVRGVVELFRSVGRVNEVNREILAFSISHNRSCARIYAHFAVINGGKTSFHRHHIKTALFSKTGSGDMWSAYKFVRNVYQHWMPMHLNRLRSAVAQVPDALDFEVSEELGDWGENDGNLGAEEVSDERIVIVLSD